MPEFIAQTICLLGRQPALGAAELESLYGADHVQAHGGFALLDIPAEEIDFRRLGGTIKVARLLTEIKSSKWTDLVDYLIKNIPDHLKYLPEGKFTLGLSVYGPLARVDDINKAALIIKKEIKKTGRPVRIVPNKAPALNSAQVLHNRLTHKGAWELVFIKHGKHTLLAQTLFVQDIEAYAARDQARPFRDPRVGMLPPKLAQILVNMAIGQMDKKNPEDKLRIRVLDPFCGTGVVLQEALLMGYSVYGTDIEARMIDYTKNNLGWLVRNKPDIEGLVTCEIADATNYQWAGFSCVASEVFLGRPLVKLPDAATLKQVASDANTITKKFLKNLLPQLKPGKVVCLAVPAWRRPDGQLIHLPVIDQLTDMGYNYLDFKNAARSELVYFREDQVVARQILRLKKA